MPWVGRTTDRKDRLSKAKASRYEIERISTLGRTVHWWLVYVNDTGSRSYIKKFNTRKKAQEVIDRWSTLPGTEQGGEHE